jgi:hypothetical protein
MGHGYGFNPIPPTEIDAWSRQRRIVLDDWEIDALEAMDSTRLNLLHADLDKSSGGEKDVVSDRPVTTALFDALFS